MQAGELSRPHGVRISQLRKLDERYLRLEAKDAGDDENTKEREKKLADQAGVF